MKLINDTAKKHFNWVESKGWHNKTPLESIALIGSEIGEAMEEAFKSNGELLSLEVADIYLRCMDLAVEHKVDLDKERQDRADFYDKFQVNVGIILDIAYLTIPLGKLANTTRYKELPEEFSDELVKFMLIIEKVAKWNHLELFENIDKKININLRKDHKKRIK
jgi:NTP pyrophosphatase (non-canonical NTP hydrolase)